MAMLTDQFHGGSINSPLKWFHLKRLPAARTVILSSYLDKVFSMTAHLPP
jgi:hypothetical protein